MKFQEHSICADEFFSKFINLMDTDLSSRQDTMVMCLSACVCPDRRRLTDLFACYYLAVQAKFNPSSQLQI
jgi:hypothetical protein